MLTEYEILKGFLKAGKLRVTPQRKTILEVFLSHKGHVEVGSLFLEVQEVDPSVGIVTFYRTMNLLVECGLARKNGLSKGQKTFEKLYHQSHHDHLVCTQCNKIVEFEHPLIEKYQLEVCQAYGFFLSQHQMEIYGVCANCQK